VKLRQILRYIGASQANMEEGNMRCEPNVSIRPLAQHEFGVKVELKNINSFRHVYDGIKYEVNRQTEVLDSGGRIAQETRGWREDSGRTVSQRSKEFAHDYRYFPEPDLPPLVVNRQWVDEIRARMPELPDAKLARFQAQYGLSEYDVSILIETRAKAEYFEAVVALAPETNRPKRAKAVANWINSELARLLNARNIEITEVKIAPDALSELIDIQEDGTISGKTAKSVFEEMFDTGNRPKEIVQKAGLVQITASDEIAVAVERVLAQHAKAADDYRRGKEEALKFLVGQVMRETRGRANPGIVHQLLQEKLSDHP
jgi:aspartyl-tRNA(Asn)/glutamyl-tRNA(Gln) amidotransferase subunit B